MKKLMFILAALVVIASGVAAVSAYEAHLINVKAHVELALTVDQTAVDFGTSFPEEWRVLHREVGLSKSAIGALGTAGGALDSVTFKVAAEWKPIPAPGTGFYNWAGYFTYLGWDVDNNAASMKLIGVPPVITSPATNAAKDVLTGIVLNAAKTSGQLYIAMDIPDFEGFYNQYTDVNPKPSGLSAPTYIVPANTPGFNPTGMDFGVDVKIQVTNIARVP